MFSNGEMVKKYLKGFDFMIKNGVKLDSLKETLNEMRRTDYDYNLGVPAMLFTAISQYTNKKRKEITLTDMLVMHSSINGALDGVNYSSIKRWRKVNNLSFFGMRQYELLSSYLKEKNLI